MTTAVAEGNLSPNMDNWASAPRTAGEEVEAEDLHVTIQAAGEINMLKDTVNRMVDQCGYRLRGVGVKNVGLERKGCALSAFASEVMPVVVEVGTAGKLSGRTEVEGQIQAAEEIKDKVNWMVDQVGYRKFQSESQGKVEVGRRGDDEEY
ncbi:hypothetical protein K438DRAFT_1778354 [Mycena galopus ATCC 62051]|nr:hypothetical protein K438DRAFT_1778354 [Mycena galopus ATCC 62051]